MGCNPALAGRVLSYTYFLYFRKGSSDEEFAGLYSEWQNCGKKT